MDDLVEREEMLNRFRRLIGELLRGAVTRTSFSRWEIEILLDLQTAEIEPRRRAELLRQYLRAVERQLDYGPGPPMKFTEFLQLKMTRRPSIE